MHRIKTGRVLSNRFVTVSPQALCAEGIPSSIEPGKKGFEPQQKGGRVRRLRNAQFCKVGAANPFVLPNCQVLY